MSALPRVLGAFVLLSVCATGTCCAPDPAPDSATVTYSRQSPSAATPVFVTSASGVRYRLWLKPERDVNDKVIVLELVMQKATSRKSSPNLLNPHGRHGYQPFDFAASDFANGAKLSSYGENRSMDLPNLHMKLQIRVNDAHSELVHPPTGAVFKHEMDSLALAITVE